MTSGRFQLNSESSTSTNVETGAGASTSTADATNANSNGTSGASLSTEHIRKFVFSGTSTVEGDNIETTAASSPEVVEKLEIKIPELLQSGCYSFYTWPCAPILACFLWERRHALVGKRVLELGSGTALPGILAAKCGAHVVLSDNCILPKSLAHIRKSCLANNLTPGHDIDVIGLSWGLLLNSVFTLGPLDLIIAADCFYDPTVFEDIIVTIAFLLERNPGAKFFFTYQERSADWSIEALLKKWKLCAHQVNIDDLGKCSGVDVLEFMGGHTIHLIELICNMSNAPTVTKVYKLFVGNLPWTIGQKELQMYFSKFGHVASSSVVYDKQHGFSKGYGFIAFSSSDALNSATNQNTHTLEGRVLTVTKANT